MNPRKIVQHLALVALLALPGLAQAQSAASPVKIPVVTLKELATHPKNTWARTR